MTCVKKEGGKRGKVKASPSQEIFTQCINEYYEVQKTLKGR